MFSTDFLQKKLGGSVSLRVLCFLTISILNFTVISAQLPSTALACNNNVQVSLDDECEAEITPGMILEGEDEDNLDAFTVSIEGVTGTVVTVPGVYTVTVTETSSGNHCWGTITVEDKLPPVITDCACPPGNTDPDCQFLCTDLAGLLAGTIATPQPVVIEGCSGLNSNFSDQVSDGVECGQKTITRTWNFVDGAGNEGGVCIQEFNLDPVTLIDVTPPTQLLEVPCGSDISMPGLVAHFTPLVGSLQAHINAYPSVNGSPLTDAICNIMVSKSDLELPVCNQECSNSVKLVREWTILDWCGNQTLEFTQIIKAVDSEAPIVEARDTSYSTNPWLCEGSFFLPVPTTLEDNCTDYVSYSVTGPFGVNVTYSAANNLYYATEVPKGEHTFTYVATDCCGNIGTHDITVTVSDQVAPVAVAKEYIVVTLTNGGVAKVFAPSLDNGSHDGCTDVHLEIRRDSDNCGVNGNTTFNNDGHPHDSNTDPDYGEFVMFCCEDVAGGNINRDGEDGYHKVWLRVWDDADMNQEFGTAGDNYNETWTFVKVEDKLAPTIICPPTANITCEDNADDLSLTGTAIASAVCDGIEVDYNDDTSNLDCGSGYIIRNWYIVGNPSVTCPQQINVQGIYYNGDINFPQSYTTNCIALEDNGDIPSWSGNIGCSSLGYSIDSDTFTVEQDACLKILNRWTVIDWCVYDPNSSSGIGMWTETQIIKVIDDEEPEISCEDSMYPVDENCEYHNPTFSASAMDIGDCPSPWLKWRIFVDLYGDGYVDYEFSTYLSPSDNSFNDSNGNGIPDRYLAPTSPNELAEITLPISVPGSMANHKIEWKVSDGCGNITSCTSTHMIVDKKKPTPYCMSVSSALMENGAVELWACDFDLGSFDNCTAQGDLRFTFTDTPPELDPDYISSLKCSSKSFTCFDIEESSNIPVRMYVWDEKGEYEYCEVMLTLIDNQGACGEITDNATISGRTLDPYGEAMGGVTVSIENVVDGPAVSLISDDNGSYTFENVTPSIGHRVSGKYDENYRKGVNTLDLVLIQRHILGLQEFDNVNQTIAADITNDETISPADLLSLRKLILGLDEKFTNQDSYVVIDANGSYEDIHNPWPLSEEIIISEMNNINANKDLKVVKIGDVNMDGFDNAKGEDKIESRSNINLELEAVKTQEYVSLHVKHLASLVGLQMVLNLNDMKVKNITSQKFSIDKNMYDIRGGKLYISLASAQIKDFAKDEVLLTIHTSKPQSLTLDSDENLTNEAYLGNELNVVGVAISNRDESISTEYGFELAQNEPNPFKQVTTFSYTLPKADFAEIAVYDLNGKQISKETVQALRGINSYKVDLKAASSGVYYYTINTTEYSATKKMILID